jgi:hypothetical protein
MQTTRASVLIAVSSFSGCALITNLSGLGQSDAGNDATMLDAMGDSSMDHTSTSDANTSDAGSDCGHLFCDNFDNEPLTFPKWDIVEGTGGQLLLSNDAVTPPYSLEVVAYAGPTGGGPSLTKEFGSASKIHFEVDLKGTCAVAEADLVTFHLTPPPPGYTDVAFTLYQSPATAHLALSYVLDGGASIGDAGDIGIGVPSFATWHHYAIDVDFGAETLNVTYTSADAGSGTTGLPIVPPVPSDNAFNLVVGISSHSTLGANCTANFDDVTLDTP